MSASQFIRVILPVPVRGTFTYRVPEHLWNDLAVGKRVVVPFGKRRYYSALVYKLNTQPAQGTRHKDVSYVVDDTPVITEEQLSFWEWIAHYYMCGLGAVMNVALPNAMKLSSQTDVCLNPDFEEYTNFGDDERMIIAQLSQRDSMGVKELEALGTKRSIQRSLNALLKQGVVLLTEVMQDEMKPKMIPFLQFAEAFSNETALNTLLEELGRAPRQMEAVMRMLSFQKEGDFQVLVKKDQLVKRFGVASNAINSLIDKGVLQQHELLDQEWRTDEVPDFELNSAQQGALETLQSGQNRVGLLYGVTGSGKTLVYAEMIKQNALEGKQTLYLVPEIALTTQLVQRLKRLLGNEILVYHSRFTNRERLTTWVKLIDSAGSEIIIGPRSALFLPLNNLGLIIVDEEHESSFKQHESAPHYSARDAAIWLAHHSDARVVLGSATPAIESYHNARSGKYNLATLTQRFDGAQLPSIRLVDMTTHKRANLEGTSFSGELAEAIKATLAKGMQVILFQNRRGFAPYLLCETCGWSAECTNCDVNLTYHKYFDKLLCHYCGYGIKKPSHCPSCGSAKTGIKGFGTEKLEQEIETLFPKARVARMDLDTTRKKNAFQKLLDSFDEQSIDILVGTQMVTKGLDFENVGLVGVMNADALWNKPDFRAFERAYQLLTQVAGRAGRKKGRGEVLVQTYKVGHPVLDLVVNRTYNDLYTHQFAERQQFLYPPFVRMVKFRFSHADAVTTKLAANYFVGELKKAFQAGVLGPEEPPIARIRGKFLRQAYLKMDARSSVAETRKRIWSCVDRYDGHEDHRKVRLEIDVDPY